MTESRFRFLDPAISLAMHSGEREPGCVPSRGLRRGGHIAHLLAIPSQQRASRKRVLAPLPRRECEVLPRSRRRSSWRASAWEERLRRARRARCSPKRVRTSKPDEKLPECSSPSSEIASTETRRSPERISDECREPALIRRTEPNTDRDETSC